MSELSPTETRGADDGAYSSQVPNGEIQASGRCDGCEDAPWAVRFEWSYTGREQYCIPCLTPILFTMADCQQITWRAVPGHPRTVTLPSTNMLIMALGITREQSEAALEQTREPKP